MIRRCGPVRQAGPSARIEDLTLGRVKEKGMGGGPPTTLPTLDGVFRLWFRSLFDDAPWYTCGLKR